MIIKRGRKAQVTVFIITGLIILIAAAMYFYLSSAGDEPAYKEEKASGIAAPVQSFVKECVRRTGEDAVLWLGMQGGYYSPAEPVFPFGVFNVPVYYYEGKLQNVPDKAIMEEQLAEYLSGNLGFCLNDFETFASQGYTFETGNISSVVLVGEKKTMFSVNFPVTASKGNARESISRFSAEVPVELPKMLGIVEGYLAAQQRLPDSFRLKHLMDLSVDNKVITETIEFRDGYVMFNIIDPDTQVRDMNYSFVFMVKYSWDDIAEG